MAHPNYYTTEEVNKILDGTFCYVGIRWPDAEVSVDCAVYERCADDPSMAYVKPVALPVKAGWKDGKFPGENWDYDDYVMLWDCDTIDALALRGGLQWPIWVNQMMAAIAGLLVGVVAVMMIATFAL